MESAATGRAMAGEYPFPATMWSRVLRLREGGDAPGARLALNDLCAAYLQPVAGYIRALGCEAGEAEDIAQDFFAVFLRRGGFQQAEPERGRLRAYLKGAIRHHVYHWRRDRAAAKRGGGAEAAPLDEAAAAEIADAGSDAEALYDQQWALTVLERALAHLKAGYEKRGKLPLYERLKPALLAGEASDAAIAEELGLPRGAIAVEQHRAKRRLAELLRREVAETLDDPAEAEAELLHLLKTLAQCGAA